MTDESLNRPQQEPWPQGAVSIREFFDAALAERDRATAAASVEREKAASALRESLAERIDAGDTALERHIGEQIRAIHAALNAQERFSQHVDDSAKELIESHFLAGKEALRVAEQEREKAASALRNSLIENAQQGDRQLSAALVAAKELADQRHEASELAVAKAFSASTELAAKHNDLIRAGERDKDKYATKGDIASMREIVEKSMEVLGGNASGLGERIGRLEGHSERRTGQEEGVGVQRKATDRTTNLTLTLAGLGITIFLTLIVVAVNVLTTT